MHSFDPDIATKYGMLEAVLFQNICYWVDTNKANEQNFNEGRYWTYNSIKAFEELFPYASKKQIRSALEHLRNEGLIMTNSFNNAPFDRTLWYTITEKGEAIRPRSQMHLPCGANGDALEGKPIPNIKPNINTKENTLLTESTKEKDPRIPTLDMVKAYWEEKHLNGKAEEFFSYYESNGWRVGKNPMKKWRAAASGWSSREVTRHSNRYGRDNSNPYSMDEYNELPF